MNIVMITQKLFKNGNSIVVSIPKEILKKYNLRDGSQVVLEEKKNGVLFARQEGLDSVPDINTEFHEWLAKFNKKYAQALEELSKK